jgi:hypothetical protein
MEMTMPIDDRVPNETLLEAGLALMAKAGKPLTPTQTKGRSMIYAMPKGETVRVRTCNDHILVILAENQETDAKLNIEGTTHVLIVMPRKARTAGYVDAYLVPSEDVAKAARTPNRIAVRTQANRLDNLTWNLWFSEKKSRNDASGFAKKWAHYRLPGEMRTDNASLTQLNAEPSLGGNLRLGDVIAAAKRQIAEVAGVSPEAVRISLDLT